MHGTDVIIIGSGLAGLTAGLELTEHGKRVLILEKEKVIGGRTSSWDDNGMLVESGFHRHIGFYRALPNLLRRVGVDPDEIVQWEEKVDVRIKGESKPMRIGISPLFDPAAAVMGVVGNRHVLSIKDKLSLARFLLAGFVAYRKDPDALDQLSVKELADRHSVSENVLHYVLIPLSAGVFFLPPHQYSAKVFFGLFFPAIPRFYKLRIGAYLGGMTEVLAKPISNAIERFGGEVRTETTVERLLTDGKTVSGVVLKDGTELKAKHVVLASDLGAAKRILLDPFSGHASFKSLFTLPTMPAVTVQMDFSKPVLPYDRTTFGPLTALASFAEQSRSTFTHVPGRLSLILTPPEKFLDMPHDEILQVVIEDGKKLGMDLETNLIDYRVISHPEDFYSLAPGHDHLRPEQRTDVKGLTLAGDYTRQPFFSTMEGAVLSGIKAAQNVLNKG